MCNFTSDFKQKCLFDLSLSVHGFIGKPFIHNFKSTIERVLKVMELDYQVNSHEKRKSENICAAIPLEYCK